MVADLGGKDVALAAPHQPHLHLDTQRLFSHEDSSFQMFSSEAYGQKNLLFKDATSELVPIATQTYEAWLGREYLHAMKGLLCDPNRESAYLFSRWLCPARPQEWQCFLERWMGRTLTPGVPLGLHKSLLLPPPCLWGLEEEASLELHGLLDACSTGLGWSRQGLSWEGSPCPPHRGHQVLVSAPLLLLSTPWLSPCLSPEPLQWPINMLPASSLLPHITLPIARETGCH